MRRLSISTWMLSMRRSNSVIIRACAASPSRWERIEGARGCPAQAWSRHLERAQATPIADELRRRSRFYVQKHLRAIPASGSGSMLLIGGGPDADRRAKLLTYQSTEGSILDAYLYTRPQVGFVPRWSRLETALHRYPIISHRTIASEAAARHILGW